MTTLITGACGFVGLNLTEAFLRDGRDVVLFDGRDDLPRDARDAFADLPGRWTFERGDVLDADALDRVLREHAVDRVVHLAVITPGADREKRDAKKILEVNLMGTMEVVEAALRRGVRRFVYPSSGAVYGDSQFDEPLLDEATTIPRPNDFYGISKYAAENAVLRAKEIWGLDAAVARVGAVFGPWEHDTGLRDTLSGPMLVSSMALRGEEVVLPRPGPYDWVYSRDVAGALMALHDADTLRQPLYNISGGVRWTVADWCEKLTQEFPSFRYRLAADGETPNVAFDPFDRSAMNVERLTSEVYTPRFGLDEAFQDYTAWMRERSDFWLP